MFKLITFLFICYLLSGNAHSKTLFVLYDAGETYGLKPIINEYVKNKKPFKVLVMGTARTLFNQEPYILDITKDCGISVKVDRVSWKRKRSLKIQDLQKAVSCYSPDLLVTGTVSQIQYQLVRAYAKKNIKSVGFIDAFTVVEEGSIIRRFPRRTTFTIVPTQKVKDSIGSSDKIVVMGQPSFEQWALLEKTVEKPKLKRELVHNKNILFIGSYGKGYEEVFKKFLISVKKLPTEIGVLVSLHPKSDGEIEKNLIMQQQSRVVVLSKKNKTYEWSSVSDLIMCYRSTVCVQALALKKNVAYFELDRSAHSNFLLESKIASRVTPANFNSEVALALAKNVSEQKLPFPLNATKNIRDFLFYLDQDIAASTMSASK